MIWLKFFTKTKKNEVNGTDSERSRTYSELKINVAITTMHRKTKEKEAADIQHFMIFFFQFNKQIVHKINSFSKFFGSDAASSHTRSRPQQHLIGYTSQLPINTE